MLRAKAHGVNSRKQVWYALGVSRPSPGPPHLRRALGLRGAPGCARPHRHDRPQLGDPHRPGREGEGTGAPPWDAVVAAAAHRFRPILLTAYAAILGMIPIAPTSFWGPMTYAIIGGLAVATLLTLVSLLALNVTWFRIKNPHPSPYQNAVVGKTAMVIH